MSASGPLHFVTYGTFLGKLGLKKAHWCSMRCHFKQVVKDEDQHRVIPVVVAMYIYKMLQIQYNDVSKMHSNEAILYFLQTGKDYVFTTTCICNILRQVLYNCKLRLPVRPKNKVNSPVSVYNDSHLSLKQQ